MNRHSPLLVVTCALLSLSAPGAEKADDVTSPDTRVRRLLEHTIIPTIELRDVSPEEALDFLGRESKRLDPLGEGVWIIGPPMGPQISEGRLFDDRFDMNLRKIPLGEALRYVCSLAICKMWIRPEGVYIANAVRRDPMFTQTFAVPPNFFAYYDIPKRREKKSWAAALPANIQPILEMHGLTNNEHDTATLNEAGNRLTARNSQDGLDHIAEILRLSNPSERNLDWVPAPGDPKVFESPSQKRVEQLRKDLRSIVLPKVVLEKVSLQKAVIALQNLARETDSGVVLLKKDFEIVFPRDHSPSDTATVSYTAERPSLAEAIQGIAQSAQLQMHVMEDGVSLREGSAIEDSIVREYLFPPPGSEAFESHNAPARGVRGGDVIWRSRDSVPWGKFFFYEPSTHRFVLCDSEDTHHKMAKNVEGMWKDYYAKEAKLKKKRP